MPVKAPQSDEAFPQDVRITNTQAFVYDSLIGVYGSTRGDVMNNLIKLGLEHLKGKRTLREVLGEAKEIREAAPDVVPKKAGKAKTGTEPVTGDD